jgi:hypothetical protein
MPSAIATAPARPRQDVHDFVKYTSAITASEAGITASPSHSGTPNGRRLPSMRSARTTFTAAYASTADTAAAAVFARNPAARLNRPSPRSTAVDS